MPTGYNPKYNAGQVAKISHPDVTGEQLAIRGFGGTWWGPGLGGTPKPESTFTNIKPMLVIDPADIAIPAARLGDMAELRTYAEDVRQSGHRFAAETIRFLADQMDRQLPPPSMEEPEWGSKVYAHTGSRSKRRTFVRYSAGGLRRWIDKEGRGYGWSELQDPEPTE
jgi:hypothetical protein